jgi:hypothetical protein
MEQSSDIPLGFAGREPATSLASALALEQQHAREQRLALTYV